MKKFVQLNTIVGLVLGIVGLLDFLYYFVFVSYPFGLSMWPTLTFIIGAAGTAFGVLFGLKARKENFESPKNIISEHIHGFDEFATAVAGVAVIFCTMFVYADILAIAGGAYSVLVGITYKGK